MGRKVVWSRGTTVLVPVLPKILRPSFYLVFQIQIEEFHELRHPDPTDYMIGESYTPVNSNLINANILTFKSGSKRGRLKVPKLSVHADDGIRDLVRLCLVRVVASSKVPSRNDLTL